MNNLNQDSDQDYINIKDVIQKEDLDDNKKQELEQEINKADLDVYQIQPKDNNNIAKILKVGKFTKKPSVLIAKHELENNIKILLISCLYTNQELLDENSSFNIIKLLVCKIKENQEEDLAENQEEDLTENLNPICCLILSFNFFDHITKKQHITNFLDQDLQGFFSITFFYDDKKIILKRYKTYTSYNNMIEELLTFYSSEYIQIIINSL